MTILLAAHTFRALGGALALIALTLCLLRMLDPLTLLVALALSFALTACGYVFTAQYPLAATCVAFHVAVVAVLHYCCGGRIPHVLRIRRGHR